MNHAVLALYVLLCACPSAQPEPGTAGPAEAVQDFASALQRGDTATAWSLLSRRTQQDADKVARAALPDAGPGSGRQMLFNSALPGRPIHARVVSQDDGTAEVQTDDDGGARTFHVVREDGRWRVDLKISR